MARPLVAICALRGRLFPEVEAAVAEQWPGYAIHLDDPFPLASYPDFVRTIWAGIGDFVIVEGDCIPPPGSIARLLECPWPWCSHPSWVGDRYLDNTLGLAKFSRQLQERVPYLAEHALAREPFRRQSHNRGLGDYLPADNLGLVPLDPSILRVWPELAGVAEVNASRRGTTAHPKAIDMRLDYELGKAQIGLHVHQPPGVHLRYANDPGLTPRLLASVLRDPAARGLPPPPP